MSIILPRCLPTPQITLKIKDNNRPVFVNNVHINFTLTLPRADASYRRIIDGTINTVNGLRKNNRSLSMAPTCFLFYSAASADNRWWKLKYRCFKIFGNIDISMLHRGFFHLYKTGSHCFFQPVYFYRFVQNINFYRKREKLHCFT